MSIFSGRVSLFSVLVLMAGLVFPMMSMLDARAYIFRSNYPTDNVIGRADNDGSSPDSSLCNATNPASIAADETYVYWTVDDTRIARAAEDGSSVDQNFITGCSTDGGVAVDGTYIYWANGGTSSIGRAYLDGTGVNHSWITGCRFPADVAVDGSYIYWTSFSGDTVGRANIDGSGAHQNWITHAGCCRGMAVTTTAAPLTLVTFMASQRRAHVKVEWATAMEEDTAGFHVWRASTQNKDFVRVSNEMIPAVGGPFEGVLYRWLDNTAPAGTTYWYKLEDISHGGLITWHGPVRATGKKPGTPGQ